MAAYKQITTIIIFLLSLCFATHSIGQTFYRLDQSSETLQFPDDKNSPTQLQFNDNKYLIEWTDLNDPTFPQGSLVAWGEESIFLLIPRNGGYLFLPDMQTESSKQYLYVNKDLLDSISNQSLQRPESQITIPSMVATVSFLDNYRFWSPDLVQAVYKTVPDGHKAILQNFTALRADIAHKLCQADTISADIFDLLEHQGIECPKLRTFFQNIHHTGQWSALIQQISDDRQQAKYGIGCAQGLHRDTFCQKWVKKISNDIIENSTIKSLVNKYN